MGHAQPFFDPREFAFTDVLTAHWEQIRDECRGVLTEFVAWHERHLFDAGWEVFPLYQFPNGEEHATNCKRCPLTSEIVKRHIPRHGAAGFSLLRARSTIHPHQGYQGDFLRCHLGLDIPDGDCGLTVGKETRRWSEGRVLVFDDRLWHNAWNNTDRLRIVFLVDFISESL